MHALIAQVLLGHTMAQSSIELLALIGPFAIVFGAGVFLVINPIIKGQGARYEHRQVTGQEAAASSNGHSNGTGKKHSESAPETVRDDESMAVPVPGDPVDN